jgi:hypothetical protein
MHDQGVKKTATTQKLIQKAALLSGRHFLSERRRP